MADITMCKGTNCPVSTKCRRCMAIPNPYRQSYFIEVPIKDGKCDMYWGENADSIWDQLNKIVNILPDEV
jgi:hypothetical protein